MLTSTASLPDISVIVVSFNTVNMTLKCLDSVVRQTETPQCEIIVVDNASQDGSPDRIKGAFPEVILIRNCQNLGFAAANNRGIRVGRGRYFFLLNSDAVLLGHALDVLVDYMDRHPNVGVVGPQLLDNEGKLHLSARLFPTVEYALFEALFLHMIFPQSRRFGAQLLSWWDHKTERAVDSVEGSAFLIRKSVVDQIGLMDIDYFMYSEEVDWCWRVKSAGYEVVYFPQARVIHYGGGSGTVKDPKLALEACRSKILFFRKHYGENETRLLKLALLLGAIARIARLRLLSSIWFGPSRDLALREDKAYRETARYLLRDLCPRMFRQPSF